MSQKSSGKKQKSPTTLSQKLLEENWSLKFALSTACLKVSSLEAQNKFLSDGAEFVNEKVSFFSNTVRVHFDSFRKGINVKSFGEKKMISNYDSLRRFITQDRNHGPRSRIEASIKNHLMTSGSSHSEWPE